MTNAQQYQSACLRLYRQMDTAGTILGAPDATDAGGEFTLKGLLALCKFESALETMKATGGDTAEDAQALLEVAMSQLGVGFQRLVSGDADDATLMMLDNAWKLFVQAKLALKSVTGLALDRPAGLPTAAVH